MKKKILTIVGARPQFIKISVISKAIKTIPELDEMILHTGQHFDTNMSESFFEELGIPKPYKNLNIENTGKQGEHTAKMLIEIEKEIIDQKPVLVLVVGDTTSTLAGALAASKLHVPVAHVEAGMRCYNQKVPEEVNRVITDHISSILFCSTQESVENLSKENISKNVYQVGDVMIDSILLFKKMAEQNKPTPLIQDLITKDYLLLTLHRQETTDSPDALQNIFTALSKSRMKIVFPIHPRTKNVLQKKKITLPSTVMLIEPQGYLDMIRLISSAKAVFTDSGGLQKEAVVLGKRCFTLREQTEWTETVKEGWNSLLGYNPDLIVKALDEAGQLITKSAFPTEKYYGDGQASYKIANHLKQYLLKNNS